MNEVSMEEAVECIACEGLINEIGGTIFRCCEHYTCRDCLVQAMQTSKSRTVRCLMNNGKKKVICQGFLNSSDIKWVVPIEAYELFLRRFENPNDTETESLEASFTLSNEDIPDKIEEYGEEGNEAEGYSSYGNEYNSEVDYGSSGFEQMLLFIKKCKSMYQFPNTEAAAKHANEQRLWENVTPISCRICYEESVPPGEAIIFQDCFHMFCKACVQTYIETSDTALVKCPYTENDYTCASFISPAEVKLLVSPEVYKRHFEELSLREAVNSSDVFQCRTPNCAGFCFVESDFKAGSMIFVCPTCRARNCIPCEAIHTGNCVDHWQKLEDEENRLKELLRQEAERSRKLQEDERNRLVQRENEMQSESFINANLSERNFMRCPKCNIPCYKFTGCNHVTCGKCHHRFNWDGREPGTFR